MNGRTVCPVVLCAALLLSGAQGARAVNKGLASGDVGMISTDDRVYGFSASTNEWVSRTIQGRILDQQTGDYLGAVLTSTELLAYNSVADLWAEVEYEGLTPRLDVAGAVAVCRTSQACYGISTVWGAWSMEPFQATGIAGGCESAGNFGLVWGGQRSCAYNGGSHQWISLNTTEQIVSGFARDGLGIVWTPQKVYAYRPVPGEWITLSPSSPQSICVTGDGKAGLVWGTRSAYGFSTSLGTWTSVSLPEGVRGGTAGGRVAMAWSDTRVCSFNAETGGWSFFPLRRDAMPVPEQAVAEPRGFSMSPNPCAGTSLRFRAPDDEAWTLEIYDLAGRRLAAQDLPPQSGGASWDWDRTDDGGCPVAAGVYWVKAESRERTEAHRLVLAP